MKHLLATAILVSVASPALAQDEIVGFRARAWYAQMTGTAEAEDKNLGPTRVDLQDDLGMGDRNWTAELQAYLHIPVAGRIYVGWWRVHDIGDDILNKQVNFAGQSFPVSTQVHSELTLDVGYLNYEFAFPSIPIGDLVRLELGASLGITALRGDASIEGGGESASDNGVVGLPTLGAHATVRLFDMVRAEVEVRGLEFRYSTYEVHYLEFFAEATVEPLPWIFAGAGYKIAAVNVAHDSSSRQFRLDVDIGGFYVTAGVRF
jgi:hypothetical protein